MLTFTLIALLCNPETKTCKHVEIEHNLIRSQCHAKAADLGRIVTYETSSYNCVLEQLSGEEYATAKDDEIFIFIDSDRAKTML